MRKTKLHLGCGHVIKEGWLNHDLAHLPGVDVVHDLRDFPWPFEDGQFTDVFMKDVLEHLPDLIGTMEELYRVTRPGAKLYITVPYWNSPEALGDPTHARMFNEHLWGFFDPSQWQCKERPYYSRARFYVRRMGVWVTPLNTIARIPGLTRDYLVFNPMLKKILLSLASYFGNVVSGLDIHLERAN